MRLSCGIFPQAPHGRVWERSLHKQQTVSSSLRLAEIVATLSLAIDLGLGQPMESFLRACLLAMRLGGELGLDNQELVNVYYLTLLRYAGCTAESHTAAAIFGDDVAANTWLIAVDHGRPSEILSAVVQHVGRGEPAFHHVRMIVNAATMMPLNVKYVTAAHCEVAQRMAERLGFDVKIQHALGQVFERWDGRGLPHRLKGDEIVYPVRIVQVAHDAEIYLRLGGVPAAVSMVRQRTGGAYDPHIAERFCNVAHQLQADLDTISAWDAVLAAEPEPWLIMSEVQFDSALHALADFTDLKSPYLVGHSRGVAELAATAAQCCGLPPADVIAVRRAGLLHDLGRTSVSTGIWDKLGPLTDGEWERVRLHPYYTERVLARSNTLSPLGSLAALHHERLNGSGYYRGASAKQLPVTARILAAADVYHALTELRPHRAPFSREAAADEVRREVRKGRLDGEAVNAVLVAAGHRVRSSRRIWPAGLTDREIEVLRLVARGLSTRRMATQLHVSERTVHHHIEHIYDKIDVTTRAAATFFAMQYNLLGDLDHAETWAEQPM